MNYTKFTVVAKQFSAGTVKIGQQIAFCCCTKIMKSYGLFKREVVIKRAGNSTRFVNVAVISVNDVSQPNERVPPKPLKQKMTKPAINTSDV